ncbi:MAG: site-specific DNA-methyltransferase [Salinivirgaceae bacterium]|nr:site-specific DNA-methyltransferase [Salinivirgaceae bacterium]
MKNKFNLITSKEWLPFQKSWFRFDNDERLYRDNIRFFTKADELNQPIAYYGPSYDLFEKIAKENSLSSIALENLDTDAQFVMIDLRGQISLSTSLAEYSELRDKILSLLENNFNRVLNRRFIAIFMPNIQNGPHYYAYAWDMAEYVSQIYSLKDDKIACYDGQTAPVNNNEYFTPSNSFIYCLYFRKDEFSKGKRNGEKYHFLTSHNTQIKHPVYSEIPGWFILKPQPRNKKEILHPAKYPEDLVKMYIRTFTKEGDNVFDPMSGTGSTELGALQIGRNGYGAELSDFFADIANGRCNDFINNGQSDKKNSFLILNKDARLITQKDFPPIDYMVTSPPYWNMLNMKGAENQAKRIEKGLMTNYSDAPDDLGNIENYWAFINSLKEIYLNIASLMKPGGYMTIVVKNIKKKGTNYPYAWDLAHVLQEKLILLPENFWCQDDIPIAPFGYGNTWVSNTFHQYCLNFQIPDE